MAVTRSLEKQNLWYFAYGSNMSTAKFVGSRGIQPLNVARVWIPGWTLTLEIPGLPYSEPAFSSIRPVTDGSELDYPPFVLGVAYLITLEQHKKVIASEGGGTAYADISVAACPVTDEDAAHTGPELEVRTLGSAMTRRPPARPSNRYMHIITSGAAEARLPAKYQRYLHQIPTYSPTYRLWQKFGALIFTAMWGPVMDVLEKIVHKTTQEDGNAPHIVINLVRMTMNLIWLTHDAFFAPIFGRGDGLDDTERDELQAAQCWKGKVMM